MTPRAGKAGSLVGGVSISVSKETPASYSTSWPTRSRNWIVNDAESQQPSRQILSIKKAVGNCEWIMIRHERDFGHVAGIPKRWMGVLRRATVGCDEPLGLEEGNRAALSILLLHPAHERSERRYLLLGESIWGRLLVVAHAKGAGDL